MTHFCTVCRITGPLLATGTPCPCCTSTKGQQEITQGPGVFLLG